MPGRIIVSVSTLIGRLARSPSLIRRTRCCTPGESSASIGICQGAYGTIQPLGCDTPEFQGGLGACAEGFEFAYLAPGSYCIAPARFPSVSLK